MQTGGVDPREFKNEGRWARKDRAGQLGRDGGWRSRDCYVSRQERESLPVPLRVYPSVNAVSHGSDRHSVDRQWRHHFRTSAVNLWSPAGLSG